MKRRHEFHTNASRKLIGAMTGALLVGALAISGCAQTLQQQKTTVDNLLHQSAVSFASQASSASFRDANSDLDFTSDGCSNWFLPDHMNDTGATYDFTAACWHHDFGYRNYKRFKAGGLVPDPEGSRKRIDDMFHADMDANCAPRSAWERPTCYARSDLYYDLVRKYGSL